jgi:hypothetical protein
MRLRILKDDSVSLNDLIREMEDGDSVIKTPHAGNVYLNNLMILSLGIPVICYDRTNGLKDRLFHPHGTVHGGRFHELARPDVLTTHAVAGSATEDPLLGSYFQPGTQMVEGHMRSLRDAFPDADIAVWGDVLADDGDLILSALDRLHADYPDALEHWYRLVDSGGILHRRTPGSWAEIRQNIFRLTSSTGGWIIPNIMNVLLCSVLQHRQAGGKTRVYHLSGPDMIGYIDDMRSDLERFASSLGAFFASDNCEFSVVPVAHIRFAALASNTDAIETMWEGIQELAEYNERARVQLGSFSEGPPYELVGKVASGRRLLAQRLWSAADGCPEVFWSPTKRRAITQYDLLGLGAGLHIPESVKATPTGILHERWKLAGRLMQHMG